MPGRATHVTRPAATIDNDCRVRDSEQGKERIETERLLLRPITIDDVDLRIPGRQVGSPRSSGKGIVSGQDGSMGAGDQRERGKLFNEVPALYERARPSYPDELFTDLVAVTGIDATSSLLEIGCGTGQATRPLAQLGCHLTAIEPGLEMAELARQRSADLPNVSIETATFEEWNAHDRRFDLIVAASSWHWIDPSIGWARAHTVLKPAGWLAVLGHVVIRRTDEPEVYAATADLHERFAPGNPDWGHPPLEHEVRATGQGWGPPNEDTDGLFGETVVRWYPTVQHFDGAGFADLLRTLSPYRRLDASVREPLLDAIAERIRTDLDDRATRHYLTVLRAGRRTD